MRTARLIASAAFLVAGVFCGDGLWAESRTWTLGECLSYADSASISLRQSRNDYLSSLEDTREARSAIFPTLSASASQGMTNYAFGGGDSNDATSYTGSYGLNASMTLFQGGKLRRALKQQKVQNSIDSLSVEENAIDLKISIIQAYMQCLYAAEALKVNESTAEASKAVMERSEELWKAGEASKVDFAQMRSQYYNDQHQVTVAKTSLDNYMLQLKQLLELGVEDEMVLSPEDASEEEVLRLIPDKATAYSNALGYLPAARSGELSVRSAELSVAQAKAGYLPTLSANAGVSTGNVYGSGKDFGNQLKDNFNESVGLSLGIPIFSGRQNKTATAKAEIALENSMLEKEGIEKDILKEVEGTWLDAVSAQSQYVSAKQNAEYAQVSYDLTEQQFYVGMKNNVELITAKSELLDAETSLLQAKYTALLNLRVLDVYQGKE